MACSRQTAGIPSCAVTPCLCQWNALPRQKHDGEPLPSKRCPSHVETLDNNVELTGQTENDASFNVETLFWRYCCFLLRLLLRARLQNSKPHTALNSAHSQCGNHSSSRGGQKNNKPPPASSTSASALRAAKKKTLFLVKLRFLAVLHCRPIGESNGSNNSRSIEHSHVIPIQARRRTLKPPYFIYPWVCILRNPLPDLVFFLVQLRNPS